MTDRRSSRLFISNLGPNSSQADLKTLFEKIGTVTSLSLSGDTAYLEFENPEHAQIAIEKYDNYKYEGSRMLVEFALKTRNFHRGKPGRSDRERDMAAGRCFKCNEKGHIAKYCPKNSVSSSRSRSKDRKKHIKRKSSSSSRGKSYSSSRSPSRSSVSSAPKQKHSKNKSKRKSSSSKSSSHEKGKKDRHKKKEHKRKHS